MWSGRSKLSHSGTLIIIDNVIRGGALIDDKSDDANVKGVRRLHEMLATEPRLSATTIQNRWQHGLRTASPWRLVTMDVT